MSLDNTPKIDYVPSDGITTDDFNNINLNIQALEDSKYQIHDNVTCNSLDFTNNIGNVLSWSLSSTIPGVTNVYTIPKGWYYISCSGVDELVRARNSLTIIGGKTGITDGGLIYSDGVNVQVRFTGVGLATIPYIKVA